MEFQEHFNGLYIPVGAFTKKGEFGWGVFRVTPHGNLYLQARDNYTQFLAFITQFMEKGKDQVLAGEAEFNKPEKGYYFFKDEKPKDFEEQLQKILTALDENRPEWLKDVNGRKEQYAHRKDMPPMV